jgi:hypothetical protein
MISAARKHLVALVADKNMESMLRGLLTRPQLSQGVAFHGRTDPAFLKLRGVLVEWFDGSKAASGSTGAAGPPARE